MSKKLATLLLLTPTALHAAPGVTYLFQGDAVAAYADGSLSSSIYVPNQGGVVTAVTVSIALDHAEPDSLDVLLVGPFTRTGSPQLASILMSDACGSSPVVSQTFQFEDDAPALLSSDGPCASGTYAPFDHAGAVDAWPLHAGPKIPSLGIQTGQNPEGHWRLTLGEHPEAAQGNVWGWVMAVTTSGYDVLIPGEGTIGIADVYPSVRSVTDDATAFGPIVDVDLKLDGLTHNWPADVHMLLVSPAGTPLVVMANACGSEDLTAWNFTIDDEAPYAFQSGCNFVHVKPSAQQNLPFYPPAPGWPYAASLAAFDGEDATGEWQLFIQDVGQNNAGSLIGGWSLVLERDGLFRDGFE